MSNFTYTLITHFKYFKLLFLELRSCYCNEFFFCQNVGVLLNPIKSVYQMKVLFFNGRQTFICFCTQV